VRISQLPIQVYTQNDQAKNWLETYQGKRPVVACVLGFTETGLIPEISAAGATPADRQFTAIADAEFLVNGAQPNPQYGLPPLHVGASPVLIARAVVQALQLPLLIFNAGLPHQPSVPAIDLRGVPAQCLSTGQAMEWAIAQHLFHQGLHWGEKLAAEAGDGYAVLAECVVGGTTTALAVLTGLGFAAMGMVNSSHPVCNHDQKWELVQRGLEQMERRKAEGGGRKTEGGGRKTEGGRWKAERVLELVAAVGDPMQLVVAGMAIAASRSCGVMLAGGTQMLAVYALLRAIAETQALPWNPAQIVVGTTRWVAEDPSGDTVGLAEKIGAVPLLATTLSFADSRFSQLQAYEQGYVKEGVGAGGCAIAAALYQNWTQLELLNEIEAIAEQYQKIQLTSIN
jgi:NaMN:DMB phosphoribosyltransferase